ncbi:hypothetical protein [Staphylococcus simulans]|uniref:hypothetical protein n=1 Tax=Staphylococcus simulans TaxID=1286 RepID=UPI000D1D667D|nr:hypothetical protein [Staphylococcus simulans]MDY5060956.1 hypothetical protein [Staphylococcus simulans]PTJ17202.1 hypothetical protein BU038_05995 [Staphylococcus simulans]
MKQTFTWKPSSQFASIPLDAFYLTDIWHRFETFQASTEHSFILRQKRIHRCQNLIEGKTYTAELKLMDQRALKHFNQSRYLLTVTALDRTDIWIEIETTFITMKETFHQQSTSTEILNTEPFSLPTHALPLEIKWDNVEMYLKDVSDYNSIHWNDGVMPGDFVVMKALEAGAPYYTELKAYRKLDIKYKRMIMKGERIYIQVDSKNSYTHMSVYNTAHQPCIEIKVI